MTQRELETNLHIRIEHATVQEQPFPHILIPRVWPWPLYQDLLTTLDDVWFVHRGTYGNMKTRIAQHRAIGSAWQLIHRVLESDVFMHALCEKWRVSPGISRALLHKDASGYSIAPHSDIESKRASFVAYFAPDMAQQHAGTWLLRHKHDVALPREVHHRWYDFEPITLLPYLPNTLVSWAPGPKSYHAVDIRFPQRSPMQERMSIRGFVFDPDAPLPFIFQEDAKERGLA